MGSAQPMTVTQARTSFVRVPQTGDELALWRVQSGLSLAKAAKAAGCAYNTFKAYEQRGHRRIPKQTSLAIAAIDAGVTL
jgi:transcriptional regulator with XRE-family HTH domain